MSLPGIDPPTPTEKLSPDRARTLRRRRMIEAGQHPVTRIPLREPRGETCGSCAHIYKTGRWFKCDLVARTGGPGTDLRKSYPACQKWEPK